MRQIHEAAAAVARAFDNQAAGNLDEALQDIEDGWAGLLESERSFIDMLDPATAARILGSGDRVRAAAQLYRAEGEVHAARGDLALARQNLQRALVFLEEAQRSAPAESDAGEIAALRERIEEN